MIAIIGAGACGLMLANIIKEDYMIFNKGKIGNKILQSGAGRCNIANASNDIINYHNNPLAKNILNKYYNKLFNKFNDLKIYIKKDNENRFYPISESSQSILNILTKNINNVIDDEIIKITKNNNKYYLNEKYGPFDKIILATGSNANLTNTYDYSYISDLNIKFNQFKPSLVGFKIKENIKRISGIRAKGNVCLYFDNKLIHKEYGEVIFKDDGISGICIMNLSSYYQKYNNKNAYIILDLADKDYDSYESIINPKLLDYIEFHNINIHNFKLNIINTYDMKFAQVASGGIDINEINDNLSLKKDNNIFVGGELIDVDGICGGFNLMFAFMCAIAINEAL